MNTGVAADQQNSVNARAAQPAHRRIADREDRPDLIDRDHLALQTGQDAALQRDILALFIEQMQDLGRVLDGVGTAAAGPDLDQALHRYRGAAAAVGATQLVAELARAEQGRAVDPQAALAWRSLRTVLDETVREARRLIAAPSVPGLAKGGESH